MCILSLCAVVNALIAFLLVNRRLCCSGILFDTLEETFRLHSSDLEDFLKVCNSATQYYLYIAVRIDKILAQHKNDKNI